MKAFPWFALALSFASSTAVAGPAGYNSVRAADAELCKARELHMTPDYRHVYARREYNEMLFSSIDCLEAGGTDCTTRVTGFNFPSDAFFSGGELYHHGIFGLVQRLPLNDMLERPGQYEATTIVDMKTVGEATAPIRMYPPAPESDATFYQDFKAFAVRTDVVHKRNYGFHSRNMFGLFTGDVRFYMQVTDAFDVFASFGGKDLAFVDVHGNAYETNSFIPLKARATDVMGNVSGSLVAFSDGAPVVNTTPTQPRSHFINGDNPVQYAGYFNSWGLHDLPAGSPETARPEIGGYVSGVYLADDASIVTTVSSLDADARPVYSHTIRTAGHKVDYTCPAAAHFTYKVRAANAKASLWAEDYTVNASAQRVFYIYGGPSAYVGIENGASTVNYLLRHGVNVTVLNYGGTRYTYATSTRLFDEGYKALDADAKDLEAFVTANYSGRNQGFLMMSSFGANYEKRFSQDFLSGFSSVILNYPAGRNSSDFNATPGKIAGVYSKIVGPELVAGRVDNAYFETLTSCPLQQRTLILYGARDTNTVPRTDYATCTSSDQVTWAEFPGGHNDDAPESLSYILNYIRTQP